MKGGEHRVRLARLGLDLANVDRVEPGCERSSIPASANAERRALAALARERADVLGHVDRRRARLAGQRHELALGLAVADRQPAAALAQLAVEVGQALEQELGPRPGLVAAVEQPVVEAEDADDPLVLVERRAQRRVVAHPQVAPKPDDPRVAVAIACPYPGAAAEMPAGPSALAQAGDEDDVVGRRVDAVLDQEVDAPAPRGRSRRRPAARGRRPWAPGRSAARTRGRRARRGRAPGAPSATNRRSSPTAEPPVRPSLTSGSPRSPGSGASSKPIDHPPR